jgi:hypothetical protein
MTQLRESSDLIAQRISDAGPGSRTVADVREACRNQALISIRKIRNEVSEQESLEGQRR